MTNYIALAIPIFFLLIGIEILIDKIKKSNLYRFNDAITNLSCGIGQQVTGIFLKTIVILLYNYLYTHYRIFTDIPNTIFTVSILFIGVDFFYYWFHRLAHEISIMWGSHVVHHQSQEYNLTVALRQTWLQSLFSMFFYLPLAIIGFNPVLFVTINSFQTLYQFWIHTKTINKLPTWFEYVFNTPSHHRVHHGINPKYIDKNHGGTLIIFDRIFGTFQNEEEEVVYGVTKPTNSWNPLWLNFDYWIQLTKTVLNTPKLLNKINLLIKNPGWLPNELGGTPPFAEVNPKTIQKYNPTIAMGLNYYIFFQYFGLLIGTTYFLFIYNNLTYINQIWIALLIISTLITIGAILEAKLWGFITEIARLIISTITLISILYFNNYNFAILLSILNFVISMTWLLKYKHLFIKTSNYVTANT